MLRRHAAQLDHRESRGEGRRWRQQEGRWGGGAGITSHESLGLEQQLPPPLYQSPSTAFAVQTISCLHSCSVSCPASSARRSSVCTNRCSARRQCQQSPGHDRSARCLIRPIVCQHCTTPSSLIATTQYRPAAPQMVLKDLQVYEDVLRCQNLCEDGRAQCQRSTNSRRSQVEISVETPRH